MPNIFAYLVLLGSPIAAVLLFRFLSLERALVWTVIGGHLILPSSTFIKFPMIPTIDRALIPAVSAFPNETLIGAVGGVDAAFMTERYSAAPAEIRVVFQRNTPP